MGAFWTIGLQFVALLLTLAAVAVINMELRFRRSQVSQSTKVGNSIAASKEIAAWKARQFMAPSRRNLILAIIAAFIISLLFISFAALIQLPRHLPALHPNSPLEAAKKQSRDECNRYMQKGDYVKAQESLLLNKNVWAVRDKLKADHHALHSARPSLSRTLAIKVELMIKHVGPMASVLPCFVFLAYRWLTKQPAKAQEEEREPGDGDEDEEETAPAGSFLATRHDSTWWTMTEELSTLLITMVSGVSVASFLLFHLWVDEARVTRCVYTSGHWFTWAVTCSCFILVCCVLAVVAFVKPEVRNIPGLDKVEASALSAGLNIVGSSVARSLFYGMLIWFGLYQALALNSLTDSQRIYHDAFEAVDGIHTARYELVLSIFLSAAAAVIYASLRDTQIEKAFHKLTKILNKGSKSSVSSGEVNRQVVKAVSGAAEQIEYQQEGQQEEEEEEEETDEPPKPVKKTRAQVRQAPKQTEEEEEEEEETVPAAPEAPAIPDAPDAPEAPMAPPPPTSFAPSSRGSISTADALAAASKKLKKTEAQPRKASSSGLSFTADDLKGQLGHLKKASERGSDKALELNGTMPPSFRGNMILDLQYRGIQREINLNEYGKEMKKKVFEKVKTEGELVKLCKQHKLNYHFPDLALLSLAKHYLEENDEPSNNMKCPCQVNAEESPAVHAKAENEWNTD